MLNNAINYYHEWSTLQSGNLTLGPCGTPAYKSEWLNKYQAAPSHFETRSNDLLYIPITVTTVGYDDGTGYIGESKLFKAIQTLNNDFLPSNIQFYIKGDFRYLNNSAYADHTTVIEGANLMFENNIPDAINCYFMAVAAGNCGYNLPYAGVAISNGCANPTDHTWAHEIGHNLSLPHPFLGWEGGVSWDGSVDHNFNEPAPTTVTYDYTFFKDTLIVDTLIIDTAIVELVDGSNCNVAADGFCDTAPDYLAQRWACNPAIGTSSVEMTDPNGETFRSDGSLIMSYAADECANRFSDEQIAAMRANLIDEKATYMIGNDPPPAIEGEVDLLFPEDGASVNFEAAYLEWEPVENASFYLVEASYNNMVTSAIWDTITSATNATASFRRSGRTAYWKITPFSSHEFDYASSAIRSMELSEPTSTNNIIVDKPYQIRSTTLGGGQTIEITFETSDKHSITLIDINGQIIEEAVVTDQYNKRVDDLQSGLYILQIAGQQQWTEKLIKL